MIMKSVLLEATTQPPTQEGIAELFKIYESDIDLFIELIKEDIALNVLGL